jgi:hypothetical protein
MSQQHVTCLKDCNGLLICGSDNIGSFFMEHFNSRFTSSHPILDDNPFDLVEKVITEEENVRLCLIPDEKEFFFFFFWLLLSWVLTRLLAGWHDRPFLLGLELVLLPTQHIVKS